MDLINTLYALFVGLYRDHVLSAIIISPLLGALMVLCTGSKYKLLKWMTAFLASILSLLLSIICLMKFSLDSAAFQFVETIPWLDQLGVQYSVGLDGLGLILVLLTTGFIPLVLILSEAQIKERQTEFIIALLVLESAILGAVLSLNLVIFYLFWEFMLIPMALIIGVWGSGRRIYAAVKFFLFTLAGGLAILLAIIGIAVYSTSVNGGVLQFDLLQISLIQFPLIWQRVLFWLMIFGFAVKVPIFPLHTWLPDAHVEAPTGGSVILASVLLKLGIFGMARFCIPLFPDAAREAAPFLILIGVIGVIYGGLAAWTQENAKKLIAYSSVSHMGFILIGLFSLNLIGVQGAMIQMINHGLSTGALFILAGALYHRTHTLMIRDYGGIAKITPNFAATLLFVALSSIGMPGLNGFVGEFLILLGAFRTQPIMTVFAAFGVVIAAIYMLGMYRKLCFGELNEARTGLTDLNFREKLILFPIIILILFIGLMPNPVLRLTESSTQTLLKSVQWGEAQYLSPLD